MIVTTPPELAAFLASGAAFRPVNLLTITLQSEVVLRYTDADTDLPVAWLGGTFLAGDALFKRTSVTRRRGIEVDTLTLDFYADDNALVGGVPFLAAANTGAFDFASVRLDIGVMTLVSPSLMGTFPWFVGDIAEAPEIDGQHMRVSVKSFTARLDVSMPRNLVQPGCVKSLFSPACGLSEAAWMTTAVVQDVLGQGTRFRAVALSQADGYFDRGRLLVTSGANTGVSRRIKSQVGRIVTLFAPLPFPIAAGDQVSMSPGCNKTADECTSKFNNRLSFKGIPFVPTPETVL